jgi:competence ComEA-like helix-hairpin-helix protein
MALCIIVLGLRWHQLSRRVPLTPLRATATAQAQPAAAEKPERVSILLDINAATALELQSLPGIGRVLASRIVEYRKEHGPFTQVSDLLRVEGIGEGKLMAIKDLIDARPPDPD